MGCHHHPITMQKFFRLTSSLTNHRTGIYHPSRYPLVGILLNSRRTTHFKQIEMFFTYDFTTRGLQGCLLEFWPLAQNHAGAINQWNREFTDENYGWVAWKRERKKLKRLQGCNLNCLLSRGLIFRLAVRSNGLWVGFVLLSRAFFRR